jgi:hypothetical protein
MQSYHSFFQFYTFFYIFFPHSLQPLHMAKSVSDPWPG